MRKHTAALSILLTLAMLISALSVITASAAENITIETDQTTYGVGESIMVTVDGTLGSTTDWWGILPKGASGTIFYGYLTAAQMGQAFDANAAFKAYYGYDLPAGEYQMIFVPNNDYATAKTAWADFRVVSEEPALATNKEVYDEGEPILVTASGCADDKDWIGIQPKDDTGNSIYWYYITDENNGKPVDIKAEGSKANRPNATDYDLPAGNYIIYFVPDNGYATSKTLTVEISIVKSTGWNGADTAEPEGEGTKESPYLIASAANLAWMSAQIGDGTAPTEAVNPFDGKYFLQTADIDLNGKTLRSIGYYYSSATACAVFGGSYDGQGYRILNGTVQCPNLSHDFNINWGSGLFGVILGAEINNVNLDGITATGIGVVGTVVGRAAADTASTADPSFNRIANCTVSDTCSVQATYVNTASGQYDQAGRIGGIVGMAYSTTVEFCSNEGAINVLGNINYAGGIAGTVGFGTTVRYCSNTADIALDNLTNANASESAFGGIVGFISPYGTGNSVKGDVLIQYCYNTGCFDMAALASPGAISYGGILGAFNTLTAGASYCVEYCYNLNDSNDLIDETYRDIRVAGLVGCGWQQGGAASEQLLIRSSASVEIVAGKCLSWYGNNAGSCNEYNVRDNVNAAGVTEIKAEDVTTAEAEELDAFVSIIDASIAAGVPKEFETLSTNYDFYLTGESIYITAFGSPENLDWVGIRPKGDSGNSIYWYYITDENNGKPVDIKAVGTKANRADAGDYELPAGDYEIFLVPNNGYAKDQTKTIEITISDHVAANQREYLEGEPVYVRGQGNAAAKDWIGIQPKDDTGYSIYWYYLTNENMMQPVDLKTGQTSTRTDPNDYNLPAGNYIVYFVPSNGYATSKTEWVEITISKKGGASALEAPISATYELENETDGMADGKLTVTLPEDSTAHSILMYWADENGKLEGYTALAKFKVTGTVTEHLMTPNTLIPAGATKLLVYAMNSSAVSEECVEITLPTEAASGDLGEVKNEFWVLSDIHIKTDDNHKHNKNFLAALEDIAAVSPNATGIFINGDMADTGSATEYEKMWAIYNAAKQTATLPSIFLSVGNHDFYNHTYAEGLALFVQNAKLPDGSSPDKPYYDFWKDGYHYIFLGSEQYPISNVNAYITDAQTTWLDERLQESRNVSAPTFVFLHQALSNTVAGSFDEQGWSGVTPEAKLRAVLKKYPEVILFNGHSHWTLNSENTMYERDEDLPTIFNTASVGYLWTSYDVVTGVNLDGSQGYCVRVYEDRVVVLGRDFTTGEWIPSAIFSVDYSNMDQYAPETGGGETTGGETTGDETTGDETTAEETVTGAEQVTGDGIPASSGCKSVVSAAPIGLLALVLFSAMAVRKKKED